MTWPPPKAKNAQITRLPSGHRPLPPRQGAVQRPRLRPGHLERKLEVPAMTDPNPKGTAMPYTKHPLNDAQEAKLRDLCERYGVEFDPDHYHVYPPDASMMAGWAEGWIGGPRHANPTYAIPAEPAGKPTIYIGVSREGDSHS